MRFFFFFSSRRRHTISKRDWSSDVCSSDLFDMHFNPVCRVLISISSGRSSYSQIANRLTIAMRSKKQCRSEERRVGKEVRQGASGGTIIKIGHGQVLRQSSAIMQQSTTNGR